MDVNPKATRFLTHQTTITFTFSCAICLLEGVCFTLNIILFGFPGCPGPRSALS